jgi:hypothetical protein
MLRLLILGFSTKWIGEMFQIIFLVNIGLDLGLAYCMSIDFWELRRLILEIMDE